MIEERPKEEESQEDVLNVKDEEKKGKKEEYNLICPEKKCNLIPEIISVHSDIGKIVLCCSQKHHNELNIIDYYKILKKKKDVKCKKDYNENDNLIQEDPEENSRTILSQKSKDISSIIRTHKKIVEKQENHPNNYLHYENLMNLYESISEEDNCYAQRETDENLNASDSYYTIDDIIEKEIKEENRIKEQNKAIEQLEKDYGIYLKDHFEKKNFIMRLKGKEDIKKLKAEGFQLISKIRFKNLIELNLANNLIDNIACLNDMLLPHLEIINLSNNEIKYIHPVADLFSKNLQEIYLQKNKIEDLGPFLNSRFPYLEIFRVDNNEEAFKKSSFPAVLKKYKGIIVYMNKSWDDFNKEYFRNYNGEEIKMELDSIRKEQLLIDLYSLVIFPNNIKSLFLDDNRFQNVNILNRIPLYNLEFLDLAMNLITNIRFVKRMSEKCKELKVLYLDNNKINDISPLIKYDEDDIVFPKLECLTLKDNNLNLKDDATSNIIDKLIKLKETKKLTLDLEDSNFKKEEKKKKEKKSK